MNAGVVSYRYAKALLKYVQETGSGNEVCSQIILLLQKMSSIDHLREILEKRDDISIEKKIDLMSAAVEVPLSEDTVRFVHLLHARRRLDLMFRIFQSFVEQYRELNNIRTGSIVTAVPADGLRERMEDVLSRRTGAVVTLSADVDPDLIGGFVLKLGDYRMDASVKGSLDAIREGLIENNNRIV